MGMRQIDLTNHFDEFVDSGVRSGRFTDASDVVREGLRLLEQHEKNEDAKIEWLKRAADVGFGALENGDSLLLESSDALHEFFSRVHTGARTHLASHAIAK